MKERWSNIIYDFKTVIKSQIQKHASSSYTIYKKKRNKNYLVLNYCKHKLKENYFCIFQFYTWTDKCSLFSQRVAWLVSIWKQVVPDCEID